MTDPKIASRTPYFLDAKPGKYAWCSCGHSKQQPFCDGAHSGTGMVPLIVEIDSPRKVAWCGCKHTCDKPYCDGSHGKLPQ